MAIAEKYASSAGAGAKDGSSADNAWDWATMLSTAAAGDRVNFLGDHTLTANAAFTNAGSATAPLIVRGYTSTIGDLAANGRTNGNGALITTGFPTWACGASYSVTHTAHMVLQNLAFTGSRNGSLIGTNSYAVYFRCAFTHSGTGASSVAGTVGTNSFAVDCDYIHAGASGGLAALSIGTGWAIGCRCDGGPNNAINITGANATLVGCTAYSAGGDAVYYSSGSNNAAVIGCTLVGAASDGFHQITGASRLTVLVNNLITDNGAYGIYAVDAAAGIFAVGNRLDRNTTAATSGATDWLDAFAGLNNTTSATQANEYEAAGSDDYRLKSTSPALSIGIPLYGDLGALQQQPAASSGGASGGRKGPLGMWKIG